MGATIDTNSIDAPADSAPLQRIQQALAEFSDDLVWSVNLEGTMVYANAAWHAYTGLSLNEVNALEWHALVHPDDVPPMAEQWGQAFKDFQAFSCEFRYRRKDGAYRWFVGRRVPVYDENGTLTHWAGQCTDVHDRRKTERDLQETSARVQAFMEYTPTLAWVNDSEGRALYGNPLLCEVLGLPLSAIVGKKPPEFVPGTHGEHHLHNILEVVRTGRLVTDVETTPRADGSIGYFLSHKFPIPQPDGSLHVGGVAVDVTEQRAAQLALAKSERRLRTLVGALTDVPWFTDARGRLAERQPAWEAYTGQTFDEEAQAYDGFAVVHPDDRETLLGTWQIAVRSRQPLDQEFRVWSAAHQEYRRCLVRAAPVLDQNGEVTEWVGSHSDVEDQRRAEEEIRLSEERFRKLADSMSVIVWCTGAEGGSYFTNKLFHDYTGIPRGDERAHRWDEVVHPEDLVEAISTYHEAREAQTSWDHELRLRNAEGQYRWHLSRCVPVFDDAGELTDWFGTSTDIHELVTLSQELEQRVHERTTQLQMAVKELEGFTYSISHDLRAPLRSIIATSRILVEDFGDGLPDAAKDDLDRQARAALRLGTLIDELLKLSRIGRRELQRGPVDLAEIARIAWQEVAALYPDRDMQLLIADPLPDSGDGDLLRMALANLLENAVKYSPNGGRIHVGKDADGYYIRDEGIGFDMAYEPKVWLPFERLVTESEYPGTGIGLANVRRIVERHGGRTWAKSQPGMGATFYFTLG